MLSQAEANRSNGSSNGDHASYDFDLFTIGAGSGGVRASRFAAQNYGRQKVDSTNCSFPVQTLFMLIAMNAMRLCNVNHSGTQVLRTIHSCVHLDLKLLHNLPTVCTAIQAC